MIAEVKALAREFWRLLVRRACIHESWEIIKLGMEMKQLSEKRKSLIGCPHNASGGSKTSLRTKSKTAKPFFHPFRWCWAAFGATMIGAGAPTMPFPLVSAFGSWIMIFVASPLQNVASDQEKACWKTMPGKDATYIGDRVNGLAKEWLPQSNLLHFIQNNELDD